MASKYLGGMLAAVLLLSVSGQATAFCRTTTCDSRVENCNPPAGQCLEGKTIFWPSGCTGFSVQQDASPPISLEVFEATVVKAFKSWLGANCNGQPPSIRVYNNGPVVCDAVEYNRYAGNANIIMFREDVWPYEKKALGLTTVSFEPQSGQIRDVDIEINAADYRITTSDSNVEADLESIVVHELGHFFGLAHSSKATATMYATAVPGSTGLRTLTRDDYDGLCAIYPPDRNGTSCDPSPQRGLKTTCGDGTPPASEGCSCRLEGLRRETPAGTAFVTGLLLLFVLGFARRRKSPC